MPMNLKVVGTRLHGNASIRNLSRLQKWIDKALNYSDKVLIATDVTHFSRLKYIENVYGSALRILYVHPWISFTQPLNTLVETAMWIGATQLILQSIEVLVNEEQITQLGSYLDQNTLVVGAKMTAKHAKHSGWQKLTGDSCPWNTLALWDVQKLGITGFLPLSSGHLDKIPGGVEEVAVISLLQKLYPDKCIAKVVNIGEIIWEHNITGDHRRKLHEKKMLSKAFRAAAQLSFLGIPPGEVHIITGEEND
ncbi:MAG: hypothetical protein BWK78_02875 [Thiotrichaceae bacterium IS1]|nr:MAG: hypothetical protein BWK78_02875 [Thiotrichaceae bacterium IS1]